MSDATDGSIGAALGAAGAAPVVAHAGKVWTVGHPTQRAKTELEQLVVQASQQALDDLKPALRPAQWEAKRVELDAQLFGRHWQTWGSLWSTVTNGPQGFPLFLLSLARPHHPEMTVADAEALWANANRACRLALMVVVPDFFDLLAAYLPADDAGKRALAEQMRADLLTALARPTLTG